MDTIKLFNLTAAIMAAITAPYSSTNASSPLTPRRLSHTGPYDPITTSSPLLANHTIYQPANITAITKTAPALVWGNNACNATTSTDPYAALNLELASWGMLILSCGSPASAFSALAQHAGAEGAWQNVSKEVGVLGTSCSGVGLYSAAQHLGVLSLAVLDTDLGQGERESTEETGQAARNTTVPVFYFSTSMSTGLVSLDAPAGVRSDFNAVAKGVPSWFGVLPGADIGDMLNEGGAGKLGRATRFWAQWMVAGEQEGSGFFVDAEGAESEGWTVMRKGLDVLSS